MIIRGGRVQTWRTSLPFTSRTFATSISATPLIDQFYQKIHSSETSSNEGYKDFMDNLYREFSADDKAILMSDWLSKEILTGNQNQANLLLTTLKNSIGQEINFALFKVLQAVIDAIDKDPSSQTSEDKLLWRKNIVKIAQQNLKKYSDQLKSLHPVENLALARISDIAFENEKSNFTVISSEKLEKSLEEAITEISNSKDVRTNYFENAINVVYVYNKLENPIHLYKLVARYLINALSHCNLESQLIIVNHINFNNSIFNGTFLLEAEKMIAFAIEKESKTLKIIKILDFYEKFGNKLRHKFAFKIKEAIWTQSKEMSAETALHAFYFLSKSGLNDNLLIGHCSKLIQADLDNLLSVQNSLALAVALAIKSPFIGFQLKEKIEKSISKIDVKEISPHMATKLYMTLLQAEHLKETGIIINNLKKHADFICENNAVEVVRVISNQWDKREISSEYYTDNIKFVFDKVVDLISQNNKFTRLEKLYLRDVISQITNDYDNHLKNIQ
jgi:hypothetical protein